MISSKAAPHIPFLLLAAVLAASSPTRADAPPPLPEKIDRSSNVAPGAPPSPPRAPGAPPLASSSPSVAPAAPPVTPAAASAALGEPPAAAVPIDVRVEGDRASAPRASRDPTVASYVARGEALRRPGETAAGAVAASPGVQIARSGAGSDLATVSIRASASASLPVYLAGVRLNDDVTGGADLSTIPLFALDRIEVYRGNAPADADRLGIGGAILIEPRLPRGTRAAASLGAGSFGELALGAAASFGGARAGALFSFTARRATNDFPFTDARGTADPADDRRLTRANGDATTFDAWALARVDLGGGGRLVLLANTFAREQGVSGTTVTPARSARSATQREIAAASVRLPCAGLAAVPDAAAERCAIEISASAITSRRSLADPDRELGLLATGAVVSGERWQQSVRVRARPGERWRIAAALFTGIDRLGIDLSNGSRRRAARLGVTGSLNTAWQISDRIELFGLAGGECHTALEATEQTACALGGPAGRAGLRIAAPFGVDVLASAGSYLRVPTLGELHGLSATVLGNPDLVPERGYTGEVSLRWAGATRAATLTGYAEVTAFARQVEDLIAYRRTSNSSIAPFNVAVARTLGAEVLAGARLTSHLRVEQSFTLLDPRDVTPGRTLTSARLPFQAALTSASLLEVSADPRRLLRVVDRVALTARLGYRSARYADTAGTFYLAEQRDLGLDASALLLGGRLAVRFGVSNVLDMLNQDLLGFPLPARAFHGAVEGSW